MDKFNIKKYFKNLTKKDILRFFSNIFLVVIGTFILSLGRGVFLVPFSIVSGGVTGIGILLSDFLPVDISAFIFTWGLFLLGLIFLGFKFSLTTLLSSIIYPSLLSIFLRTGLAEEIINLILDSDTFVSLGSNGALDPTIISEVPIGTLLICGIIGGACTGIGCSLTFLGGGSTGGVDILSFILNKFFGIKQSILFFSVDATIVGIGLILDIVNKHSFNFLAGLVGIISAFICSVMVDLVYVSKQGAYMVDIISDKYEEFIKYSSEVLDRSSTVFDVVGGYSKENKKMVRITFNKRELMQVKDAIAKIDKNAFVTFTQTMLVGGEGFNKIQESRNNTIKNLQKALKNKKNDW